jgi:signal transduction histidine kinase
MPLTSRLAARMSGAHPPRRTLRLRLTLLYGSLFLLSGAVLLAVTYVLVLHATNGLTNVVGPNGAGSVSGTAGGRPAQFVLQNSGGLTAHQLQNELQLLQHQAMQQHDAEMNALLLWSGIALGGMAILSGILGWVVAGRALRPLRMITATARRISATNLHQRLGLKGPRDEVTDLGETFDGLLTRLEASFQSQRQFVANASHELRTPLARERAVVQVALADPAATVGSLRAAHERVLASQAEQERIIDGLLALARGQAGTDRHDVIDLAAVVSQSLSARQPDAERRGLSVEATIEAAQAAGDPRLIERLVGNLVDNAIRHNIANGRVEVSTATDVAHASLSVANTGPHVSLAAIDRIFKPFQRLEVDRTSHGQGAGLGLSIVEAIAKSHGAVVVAQPRPDGGLVVRVDFPLPIHVEGVPAAAPPRGSPDEPSKIGRPSSEAEAVKPKEACEEAM